MRYIFKLLKKCIVLWLLSELFQELPHLLPCVATKTVHNTQDECIVVWTRRTLDVGTVKSDVCDRPVVGIDRDDLLMQTGSNDMSMVRSYSLQREVQLRFLAPDDIPEVKRLCTDWFPIEYPESWYVDITSGSRFYSLAATINSHIIGIIVSEIKPRSRCNREDVDILAPHYPPSTHLVYILSLGVVKEYRRHGIASLLLDNLLSYLTSGEQADSKAVYLHVLTTNSTAIRFYEQRNFRVHSCLPYYYSIKGCPHDGYSYVLYINGGQPPSPLLDCARQVAMVISKLKPCALPQRVLHLAQIVWRYLVNSSAVTNYSSHPVHFS